MCTCHSYRNFNNTCKEIVGNSMYIYIYIYIYYIYIYILAALVTLKG